jgi:hypothetical protein
MPSEDAPFTALSNSAAVAPGTLPNAGSAVPAAPIGGVAPAGSGHWELVRPPEGPAQGTLPTSYWVIAAVGGLSAAIGLAFVVAWARRSWRSSRDRTPASRSQYPRSSRAPRSR